MLGIIVLVRIRVTVTVDRETKISWTALKVDKIYEATGRK